MRETKQGKSRYVSVILLFILLVPGFVFLWPGVQPEATIQKGSLPEVLTGPLKEETSIKIDPRYTTANLTPSTGVIVFNDIWTGWPGSGTSEDPYRIENLNVTASTNIGISIQNCEKYFIISNCIIFNQGTNDFQHGITVSDSRNGLIQNCTIESDIGITIMPLTVDFRIYNNTLLSTDTYDTDHPSSLIPDSVDDGGYGVLVYSSSNTNISITNNTCMNSIAASQNGIVIIDSDDNRIANNTCVSDDFGIKLLDSDWNEVQNNNCTMNNGQFGIYVSGGGNNDIRDNFCTGATSGIVPCGIYVLSSLHNLIYQNTLAGNTYGIRAYESFNTTISWNVCYDNDWGISIRVSDQCEIENNVCYDNVNDGIHTRDSISTYLITNICYSNGNGINLVASNHSWVLLNNCTSNDYGISLKNSDSGRIIDNICVDNINAGILLAQSESNVVTRNYCESNDRGISLEGASATVRSDYNNVIDNTCVGNVNGIYLVNAYFNNVTRNQCSDITSGIGMLSPAVGNYISYNTCNNSFWGIITWGIANFIEQNILGGCQYAIACWSTVAINNQIKWNTMLNSNVWNGFDSGVGNNFSHNYYDDYTGSDANNDSIGDTAWPIVDQVPTTTNWDFYPLMLEPTPAAWVTPTTDQVVEYLDHFNYDVVATAPSSIQYYVNDTTNFHADPWSSLITNNTVLSLGVYNLEVGVVNTYGFWTNTTFRVECVDTTAPTWNELPTNKTAELGEVFSYDLNASDILGLDTWWLSDDVNFSISSEGVISNLVTLSLGVYPLDVYVNDTQGNILMATIYIESQDTTAPSWDEIPENQVNELGVGFSYDLNASDYDFVDYLLNDTSYFDIGANGILTNVSFVPVGIYFIEVQAYDPSLNYLSANITITVLDSVNPTWDQLPANQIVEYGTTFAYLVNASDLAGIHHYWVNDTIFFDISGNLLANTSTVPVGTYVLELRAYDPSDLFCSAIIIVTVNDTTPPQWTLTPTNQILEYEVTLSYQLGAIDLSGIGFWQLNDTSHFAVVDGLITSIGTLESGIYGLNVSVQDVFGNILSAVFTVTILEGATTTTTTIPSATTTTSTTPSEPDGLGPMLLVVGGIAGVAVVILLVVYLKKGKAT